MPFPLVPKFKFDSAKEEPSPLFLGVFPLSLSFPLPNPSKTKPYRSGLTDVLANHGLDCIVSIASAIFTTQLLSWCVRWSRKNNVLSILQRNLIWYVTTRFLGGKRRPSKGIRDEVDEVDWGNLPPDMWREIGQRMPSRLDILYFRSACEKWRSSLPSPTRFPLKVPPPPGCDPESRDMPYWITEAIIYSFGKGALVSVGFEEGFQGNQFRSRYVVPPRVQFEFSEASFMESPKHPISRLHFVSKAYHFRVAKPRFDSNNERVEGKWDLHWNKFAKKMVIISLNAADGVNLSYARASDLIVVAHLSWGSIKGRLGLLRLGGSPKNWDWDTSFCTQVFEDIATYKGQLCTLDLSGRVFIMDSNSLQMTEVAPPSSLVLEMRHKRLFEGFGGLYLVDLYKKKRTDVLKVYKLSFRSRKWIEDEDTITGKPVYSLMPFL